jgi:molybdate transport system ATP-binding protein
VLVTHDAEDVRALADEVVVLQAGRVTQRGTPEELMRYPATPYVARLFA